MRTLLTSLMAMIISGFAGGIIAQLIAEKTYADQEFILAFMVSALVTIVTTILFFIAQMMSNPASAVSSLGKWLAIAVAVASIALLVFAGWENGFQFSSSKENWLLVGMTVPGIVTVLTHWWFVRWRVGKAPAAFDRAPT